MMSDLEASFWELLKRHRVTVPDDGHQFMDELMALVRAYAAGDDWELAALRLQVLHKSAAPPPQGR